MNLYELTKSFKQAVDKWELAQEGSEEELKLENFLDQTGEAVDVKVDNVISYRKALLAEALALNSEGHKLKRREKIALNKADRLKDYLADCLQEGTKWKNERHAVSWSKSSSIEIEDIAKVPAGFIKTVEAVDKTLAGKELRADREIPGLKLNKSINIVIK